MLTTGQRARLISDLHLQADVDVVNARFARFLSDCAAERIDALFILGDLFEYWIGDDALDEDFNAWVAAQLRTLADCGTAIYFLHGNRDFLIGERMAQACGMRLLPELAQVGAGETAILLLHGDTLCTDDHDYQRFRALVRSEAWRRDFLARPLAERQAEVANLRARSREAMQHKAAEIMDANPSTVLATLRNVGCRRMIHGHTHRPGMETLALDGQTGERWVLSDWTATRGDALEIDASGSIRRLPQNA